MKITSPGMFKEGQQPDATKRTWFRAWPEKTVDHFTSHFGGSASALFSEMSREAQSHSPGSKVR
jgi:hypothetical protein